MRPNEIRFAVRLTARGGADRIDGVVDGVLRVRVAAPAIDGAANQALIRLLSDELGIPRTALRIVAGAGARGKLIVAEGLPSAQLLARWPDLKL